MALNTITPLTEYVFKVASVEETTIDDSRSAIVYILEYQNPKSLTLADQSFEFVQTEDLTEQGVAVQPYGAILMNTLAPSTSVTGSTKFSLKTPGGILKSDITLGELELARTVTFKASESEGT